MSESKIVVRLPLGSEVDYFYDERDQLMAIAAKFEMMISSLLAMCQKSEKEIVELKEELNKLKPANPMEPVVSTEGEVVCQPIGGEVTEQPVSEGEPSGAYPY